MKLASIEHISNISSINGFDNIELISILNFKAFAKKGLFCKDTLCIFIRCDTNIDYQINGSLINEKNIRNSIKILPYVINNIFADGIVLPLSLYPYEPSIGLDISEFFHITKNI
jgi:hypothetical protein